MASFLSLAALSLATPPLSNCHLNLGPSMKEKDWTFPFGCFRIYKSVSNSGLPSTLVLR